ncbi:MAG: hypothetical protein AUJ75_01445 [Candidatus Omnitrophica bacterium CG1_02_49_10]|nr:MAG: hypothetical protein AUJ75_01445 [Candidatus Omnitrophica bacterium CG1_02_49_10]
MDSKAIKRAKDVLRIEAKAINGLIATIGKEFEKAVDMIYSANGRVVLTGMGKPGFIAQKISATLSSTGTPSFYLHPAEAIHGDVGMVTDDDMVIALSNSGETEEVTKLLPLIKKIGAKIIAITGNMNSALAKASDCILLMNIKKEACSLGLAPTASTTAMLALGDAIAVALIDKTGFKAEDYALRHPGGLLGKKLHLKVSDIMRQGADNPVVKKNRLVKDVLLAITRARAGSATVVNDKGKLVGIFTDGDLRRHLKNDSNLAAKKVSEVMTKNPTVIDKDTLAINALKILQSKRIDEVPVVNKNGKPIGLLDVQDLLKAGLV